MKTDIILNESIKQNAKRYKLTNEQISVYAWLKQQGLNTDDGTLCFWSKKHSKDRIFAVVRFAQDRCIEGQSIRNIGGWIHKLLITGLPVVNDECKSNRDLAHKYAEMNKWNDLIIYEKYIKDRVTNDDLPLTMPRQEFSRSLEALYQKSQLYKNV